MGNSNLNVVPDWRLSESEFVSKYGQELTVQYGNEELVTSYLKTRHAWMNNTATWRACHEAFMKMKGGNA